MGLIHFIRHRFVFLLLTQVTIVLFLCQWDTFIYEIYPIFFSKITYFLKFIFSFLPFDFGNVLYLFLGIFIPVIFYTSYKRKILTQTFFKTINIVFFLYFLLWGFNYYNKTIENTFMPQSVSEKELIDLTEKLLNKTKKLSSLVNRDKNGNFIIFDKTAMYHNLLSSQNLLSKTNQVFLNRPNQKIINIKPSIFSLFHSYIGIGGIYNPFTAEATYNKTMPDIKIPFTVSHEMAHQLGYASETEANFVGFVTAIQSKNNDIKYTAYYTALKYSMFTLAEKNPTYFEKYLSQFTPQMKNDLAQEKKYYKTYQSGAEDYFSATNDMFLKLNNQQQGVKSYQVFVYMLLNIT